MSRTGLQKNSQESRYARGLIEASLDPLIAIGPDGKIIDVNNATIEMTGVSREKIIGTDFSIYFTEPARAQTIYRQALKKGSISNYALTIHNVNGDKKDVLYNATVYRDTDGKILVSFIAVEDITERKKAEVESARIAQELTNLIDTANAPIFGIDKHGNVTEWNRTAVTITGYDKRETLGRNLVEEFITEEYKIPVEEVLDKALEGMETANFEFPLYTKNRDRRDVLLNATTRRDVQGNIIGVIGVGQDITERKQLEKKLEEYAKGLEAKVAELEQFQRLTVGRELKMIELKKEVEELRKLANEYEPQAP